MNTNTVINVLKAEQALRSRHCLLLEAQQSALLACDRPKFIALEGQHGALLGLCERQEGVRRAALTDGDGKEWTISALLETLPDSPARRTLTKLRASLRQTLEMARTLSTRNEMLIQNELNYLAFTLDLFVEVGRSAGQSYGGSTLLGGRLGLDRRA